MTYEQIIQSLDQKKYSPVYFLHGQEPWYIDRISDYIARHVLSESEKGFNQQVLYGKELTRQDLLNACSRYPLMSERQVIIVREAQYMKEVTELEPYFEKPVPTTLLVFCYKKPLDKRLRLNKVLEKKAIVFESKKIAENKVPDWIKSYAAEKGFQITEKAVMLLTEYIGGDLEKLSNALDKLCLTAQADSPINEKNIEANVGISREYNVFELSNAIANRDMPRVSRILQYIISVPKEAPFPVILATLFNFFSKTMAVYLTPSKDKESLKKLGIVEWYQKDYLNAARTYGPRLRKILDLLQEYDLRFKGVNDTGTSDGELLKEMVFRIVN